MKLRSLNSLAFLLVLFAGISVSSCKKDSKQTDNLIGTWTAGTPSYTVMVGTKTLTQYYTDVVGLSAAEALQATTLVNLALVQTFTGTIQFKSDNTYTSNLGGTADTGTWSLSSDAKTLTITPVSDTPVAITINSLTSSKLTGTFTDTEQEDLNNDGVNETLTISVTMSFTK
jgi:hypothetical protein